MAIVVFSRKGIHVRQGSGEITALYIPAADQINSYRDVGATTAEVATRSGVTGQVPLWREELGLTMVYGTMPTVLLQTRQALKVWLASDFAPAECEAIFFLFNNRWLIHGIKEIDDERRETWRTTVFETPEAETHAALLNALSDLLLNSQVKKVVVAVDGDLKAYSSLTELLKPMDIAPVPFSTLKPSPRAKPLYRHRDYTLLMLVSVFFIGLMLAGALAWLIVNQLQLNRLDEQISNVRNQIANIQINENLGNMQNPEQLLEQMRKPFAQQPSAILDAASRYGATYGDLERVTMALGGGITAGAGGPIVNPGNLTPEQRLLIVETSTMNEKLLVNQEAHAKATLPEVPWIREAANINDQNQGARLQFIVQIDSPPGQNLPTPSVAPELSAAQPEDAPEAETAAPAAPAPAEVSAVVPAAPAVAPANPAAANNVLLTSQTAPHLQPQSAPVSASAVPVGMAPAAPLTFTLVTPTQQVSS